MNLHANAQRRWHIGYFLATVSSHYRSNHTRHIFQGPVLSNGWAFWNLPYRTSHAICGYLYTGQNEETARLIATNRPPNCRTCQQISDLHVIPGLTAPPLNIPVQAPPTYTNPERASMLAAIGEAQMVIDPRHIRTNGRRTRWDATIRYERRHA